MSITYPDVTGAAKNGTETTVGVGDLVTGYDQSGKLVTGRIIATHPHYPSLTIDGISMVAGEIEAGRFTVHLSKVLTHVRQPAKVGVS
jgi:hypothetical protein